MDNEIHNYKIFLITN